jgi:hypothetical protein
MVLHEKCFLNGIPQFGSAPDIKSTHYLSKVDNDVRSNSRGYYYGQRNYAN